MPTSWRATRGPTGSMATTARIEGEAGADTLVGGAGKGDDAWSPLPASAGARVNLAVGSRQVEQGKITHAKSALRTWSR